MIQHELRREILSLLGILFISDATASDVCSWPSVSGRVHLSELYSGVKSVAVRRFKFTESLRKV